MKDQIKLAGLDEKDIIEVIRESLALPKKQKAEAKKALNEAYVVSTNKFNLSTEKLSEESKAAHQELMEGYAKALNDALPAMPAGDTLKFN